MMHRRRVPLLFALPLALAACGTGSTADRPTWTFGPGASEPPAANAAPLGDDVLATPAVTPALPEASPALPAAAPAAPIDPREGGLEVGLGEWAVTLEAAVIRPGPVTFVIHNAGTLVHGFEIERDSGGGDRLKLETDTFGTGDTARVQADLQSGTYKIECLIDGHDDLGMEILLEVREDAPLVAPVASAATGVVDIAGFAFSPPLVEVSAGTTVAWTNGDSAPHTVTAEGGAFDSGTLATGDRFEFAATTSGTIRYLCAIHPAMTGTLVVR